MLVNERTVEKTVLSRLALVRAETPVLVALDGLRFLHAA